jgi:hypothetical protein
MVKVIHFVMEYDDYLKMAFMPEMYRDEMYRKYPKDMLDKEFGVDCDD